MKRIIFVIIIFAGLILVNACSIPQEENYPDLLEFIVVNQQPQVLNLNEVIKKINYSEAVRDLDLMSKLLFRVLVDSNGNYVRHKVLRKGHPLFQKEVEQYLPELKFKPAIKDGKAVAFWINIPFNLAPL